jgi:hypothetical protein
MSKKVTKKEKKKIFKHVQKFYPDVDMEDIDTELLKNYKKMNTFNVIPEKFKDIKKLNKKYNNFFWTFDRYSTLYYNIIDSYSNFLLKILAKLKKKCKKLKKKKIDDILWYIDFKIIDTIKLDIPESKLQKYLLQNAQETYDDISNYYKKTQLDAIKEGIHSKKGIDVHISNIIGNMAIP